jgi:hypothetical protein
MVRTIIIKEIGFQAILGQEIIQQITNQKKKKPS